MHGWLEAHAVEVICGLLAFVFAVEIDYLTVFNRPRPWWQDRIDTPESGLSGKARAGWIFWNGLCLGICLIPVVT